MITEPLLLIYMLHMSIENIPTACAHASVTPVFQHADVSDVSNYRLLSLTNVVCKLMECIICVDMLHYLRAHGIITRQQHGFLSDKSTATNLSETLNNWTLDVRGKQAVNVVYIDYAKAFNKVCHAKSLAKLNK